MVTEILCIRNEAVKAGNKTIRLLEGHREQSVVNNLEQIVEAGWSILDKDDTASDEYDDPDGPYEALNIDRNNCKCREAYQNWQFDNCHHRNNVGPPYKLVASLADLD